MSECNGCAIILPFYKQHTLISHNNLSCFVDPVAGAYNYTPLRFYDTGSILSNNVYENLNTIVS